MLGIVSDDKDNTVQEAIVTILEMDGLVLKPRTTDQFGRFINELRLALNEQEEVQ